jgi:ribosome-associated translation inhibitor RaiA/cold shock CspA family protein
MTTPKKTPTSLGLQISARNLEISPAIEAAIRDAAARLASFYSRIMACRVLVETSHRRRHEGAYYNVRIDLTLPGGELVVKRQPETDLLTAVQGAFAAAQRQVEDYARIQRGDVKLPADATRGRVVRLFPYEGYGFLESPDGREIYFHRNSVLRRGFDRLEVGSLARYVEEPGEHGPQASTMAVSPRRHRKQRVPPPG